MFFILNLSCLISLKIELKFTVNVEIDLLTDNNMLECSVIQKVISDSLVLNERMLQNLWDDAVHISWAYFFKQCLTKSWCSGGDEIQVARTMPNHAIS